ncbi:MAG: hypothetical protein ABIV39_18215, partial [Verrucomicrobiota bacterium]
ISYSRQYQIDERALFLASTFLNLPIPQPGGMFISISDVPCLGNCFFTRRWFNDVLSWLRPTSTIPAVLTRPSIEEQTLQEWTPEEEAFFNGNPNPEPKRKKSTKENKSEEKTYLPKAKRKRPGELPPDF